MKYEMPVFTLLPGEQQAVDEIVEKHRRLGHCPFCHNKDIEGHAISIVLGRRRAWAEVRST